MGAHTSDTVDSPIETIRRELLPPNALLQPEEGTYSYREVSQQGDTFQLKACTQQDEKDCAFLAILVFFKEMENASPRVGRA